MGSCVSASVDVSAGFSPVGWAAALLESRCHELEALVEEGHDLRPEREEFLRLQRGVRDCLRETARSPALLQVFWSECSITLVFVTLKGCFSNAKTTV